MTPEEQLIADSLRVKGCSNQEIILYVRISREVYSGCVGRIMFNGRHYWYQDGSGKDFDGCTNQNCGLFATIRLMHHLGQLGLIDKDAWWKYAMKELRYILAERIGTRNKYGNLYITSIRSENEGLTQESLQYVHYWLKIPAGYGYRAPLPDDPLKICIDTIDRDSPAIPKSLDFEDDPLRDALRAHWNY